MPVRQRQRLLSLAGYAPGPIDGIEGARTRSAIEAFTDGLPRRKRDDPEGALLRHIEELSALVPRLPADLVRAIFPRFDLDWIGPLNALLSEALITDDRLPAFFAQIGHESAGLTALEEYASGAAYEGRVSLGNTIPGDGKRFKGRGFIQLTGRANYALIGLRTGLPILSYPEIVSTPRIGAIVTAAYWTENNLNAIADSGDLLQLTRAINGGLNGLTDRKNIYFRAEKILLSAGIGKNA